MEHSNYFKEYWGAMQDRNHILVIVSPGLSVLLSLKAEKLCIGVHLGKGISRYVRQEDRYKYKWIRATL